MLGSEAELTYFSPSYQRVGSDDYDFEVQLLKKDHAKLNLVQFLARPMSKSSRRHAGGNDSQNKANIDGNLATSSEPMAVVDLSTTTANQSQQQHPSIGQPPILLLPKQTRELILTLINAHQIAHCEAATSSTMTNPTAMPAQIGSVLEKSECFTVKFLRNLNLNMLIESLDRLYKLETKKNSKLFEFNSPMLNSHSKQEDFIEFL